ncbi:hypothetical protein C8F04DRAFT_1186755 [Mycena alexandri]|uniref:Uncharacterized protein n=1 Tax=Mycena alexandri TaxID=1745969 RepID=A0AAD6SMF0_9AGAR|nr:hypothetical protein C8F04DRAFT_1186755 [Mycena alexandri]
MVIFAVGESTPLCRPSRYGKRWWSNELAVLQTALSRAERQFKRCRVVSSWNTMCDCRRAYHQALTAAKETEWRQFILQLERTNVYDVLDRLRLRPCSVFPALVDPTSGMVAVGHLERGRVLGRAWFGERAEELGGGGVNEDEVGSAGEEMAGIVDVGLGGEDENREEGGSGARNTVKINARPGPATETDTSARNTIRKNARLDAADATGTGEHNTVQKSAQPGLRNTQDNRNKAIVGRTGNGGDRGRRGWGGGVGVGGRGVGRRSRE